MHEPKEYQVHVNPINEFEMMLNAVSVQYSVRAEKLKVCQWMSTSR